jgi:molybdopterin synthase catalytic subunit
LQTESIVINELLEAVRHPAAGAVVQFQGTVRSPDRGRRVVRLDYEAYEAMAVAELKRLVQVTTERHVTTRVAVVHRLGPMIPGEISVAIAVSAAHRAEAFAACQMVIDALKVRVPIWKREIFDDGASWVEGRATVED